MLILCVMLWLLKLLYMCFMCFRHVLCVCVCRFNDICKVCVMPVVAVIDPPPEQDPCVSGLSSSTGLMRHSASVRPKRLSREQRHEQQVVGLARVLNNLKKMLNWFQ